MLEREYNELLLEIDPKKTGKVNYEALLSALFLTLMYINEYHLTTTLKSLDTDKKGGLTIK